MKRFLSAIALVALVMTAAILSAQPPKGPPGGPLGPGGPGGPGRFNPLLMVFDKSQDGVLSAEEVAAASTMLAACDADKDGKVSAEELRNLLPPGGGRGSQGPGGPGGGGFGPGGPGRGPGGPGRGPGGAEGIPDSDQLAKDDTEKRVLAALDQMREGPRYANVSPADGRLLRLLAEAMNAQRIVEIGTSTGESGVYFALALQRTGGHLFTHELDQQRAEVARANFAKAGVQERITLILGDAHETVKQHSEPIDILFLDADKEGYIDYLNKLLPLLRPGGLVIAHNMNTRQADANYVKAITENPELETLILLKEGTGVGVTLKKR